MLELVSVVPDRMELALLQRAQEGQLNALEECLQRGLLRMEGGCVQFRHELARLAIEDSLTPLRRAQCNARVLQALAAPGEDNPATLTRLAHHANASGDAAAIVRFAPRAAAAASARGAHHEASALLQAVMPHVTLLDRLERAVLFEQYSRACYLVGQVEASLAASAQARALWRDLQDPLAEARNLSDRCYIIVWGRPSGPAAVTESARASITVLEGIHGARRTEQAWIDQMALAQGAMAFGLGIEDPAGAAGLSNAAMARRLHRSVRTVEHHVAALLAKLDVSTRQDAVERARRERLIEP